VGPGETKEGYYQPLERAELVRSGKDVTILCYSRMRYVVMQAVQQLEKMGYDPEVIITGLHYSPGVSLVLTEMKDIQDISERIVWPPGDRPDQLEAL
jgi:hypothetical protein